MAGKTILDLPTNSALTGTEEFDAVQGGTTDVKILLSAIAAYVAATNPGLVVTTQAGTSYTPVLGDANSRIRFTNGAAITLTIPPNASVAFPVGTTIEFVQAGAGVLGVSAGAGVTVNSNGSLFHTNGQYAVAELTQDAANVWTLCGNLVS